MLAGLFLQHFFKFRKVGLTDTKRFYSFLGLLAAVIFRFSSTVILTATPLRRSQREEIFGEPKHLLLKRRGAIATAPA